MAEISLKGTKILLVLNNLVLGGAEQQAVRLARFLRETCQAEVGVAVFSRADGDLGAECERSAIATLPLSRKYVEIGSLRAKPWRLLQFVHALRPFRPDVLLPFNDAGNVMCGLAWRSVGAKTCIWNQRNSRSPMRCRSVRLAVHCTPEFVSNSRAGADFLVSTLGVEPSKSRVIRNAVSLAAPHADRTVWRKRLGLHQGRFVACKVANLRSAKDHETLLKAWAVVVRATQPDQEPPVLLLAGKWQDRAAYLRQLANELELYDEVRFLGLVRDISGLLSCCDMGVFSSASEGCPNGVLECMAAGLPVVASDLPGIREVLGDQVDRCLSPVGDAHSFAQRVLGFIQCPNLRNDYGVRNRMRIAQCFAPEQAYLQMAELIASELKRKGV